MLRRFWITFEGERNLLFNKEYGVTAYDYEDAICLLQQHAVKMQPLPEITNVIEDVDVSLLDAGHVLPNIGVCARRGVWHPNLTN